MRQRKDNSCRHACTVITANYLPKAITLRRSMDRFAPLMLHILVVDADIESLQRCLPSSVLSGIHFYSVDKVLGQPYQMGLVDRDSARRDAFRWSCKPALMAYLLDSKICTELLYLDSDLYFFADFSFLYNQLVQASMLLAPHWRPIRPHPDRTQFLCNFTDGLYNAGFVGASCEGLPALRWWYDMCMYRCEIDTAKGLYVDQRYLDLLPLHFDDIFILRHSGCNVAEWNRSSLSRTIQDGRVIIGDGWPLIFVHFTDLTMRLIDMGMDPVLTSSLKEYRENMQEVRELFKATPMQLDVA